MDSRALKQGSTLQNGKYLILKTLGQGGFGITYLAEQTGLGMKVAIKEFFLKGSCTRENGTSRVSVPIADNEELVSRCLKKFKSEARKIASLNNDHIVNIIDVFDENGTSYYVMKYLDGGSLAARSKGGALPESVVLQVTADICDALKSVHSQKLLHLDVKPANILFDERGRSVLIDFGVSKYVDSQQDSSTTSSLIGYSRGFAPLEQVNSVASSLSPASDIYALGATMYNLLTGQEPPEASVVMDSGLPELPAGLSDEVKEAISQAMRPRRKDRPQDIDAFMELLPVDAETKQPADDETVVVGMVPPEPPVLPKPSKWPIILSGIMLAASIVLAAVSFSGRGNESSGSETGTSAVEEMTVKVEELTQKNEALQKQVNDLGSQVNTLNSKNATLQKEKAKLQSDVNSYKPDAERWRRQMQMNK